MSKWRASVKLGSATITLAGMFLCACVAAQEIRVEGLVDVSRVSHEIGHCYIAPIDAPGSPDTPRGQASSLQLLEDDVELGPAHSGHANIRERFDDAGELKPEALDEPEASGGAFPGPARHE